MAYGTPRSLDEVDPYLRDIRGGRPLRPGAVEELTQRYAAIGGVSPLLEITTRQAAGVQAALGPDVQVFVGMKHWHPRIDEAVALAAAAGIERLVAVALAPHHSRISIGGYEERVRDAIARGGSRMDLRMVREWYDEPAFVELVARNVRRTLADWPDDGTSTFFTAHSLPERILAEGDPYRDQLLASAKLAADAAGLPRHVVAFQSASETGEPWLGPDIRDALASFAREGGARALVVPIGFVADHLEVLYDVDLECAEHARALGIELRRVPSPNDDPLLVEALCAVVRRAAQ